MTSRAPIRISLASLLAAILAGFTVTVSSSGSAQADPPGPAPSVAEYDLGMAEIPEDGPKGPVPVRLWGSIAVPAGPGPHPVVLVAHGRHGDGCPQDEHDAFTWPCFEVEQRNDLGLAHALTAIARRGAIAVAPDLNAAYSFGWGEPRERPRWRWIANRTLAEIEAEANEGGGRFGIGLDGGVDLTRIGLLGHSRSGANVVRFSKSHRPRRAIESLFLLAPAADGGGLPDLTTAVVLASCDGDLQNEGRAYLERGRRDRDRSRVVAQIMLRKANHNYFNRTLAELGEDDSIGTGRAACRPRRRLTAAEQQRWLDRAAAVFFAATLAGGERPGWLRRNGPTPSRLYGERVRVERAS